MLVHCIEKWQVTKNIKINNLNSSSLVAVHEFCFCILLPIGGSC